MGSHALDPITVLKVKTSCCKECPGKLHTALMKIEGVYQVDVAPEKKLVSIRGQVDPLMLIKEITKLGKNAELIFYNKENKIEEDFHHKTAQSSGEKQPCSDYYHNPNVRQNGKEKYFCCHSDDSPKTQDFTHHEAYEHRELPKKDDEEDIFKHPYFRFWRNASTNRRGTFGDCDGMFPNHADQHKQADFRTQSTRYDDTRNPQYSRWFTEEPPRYEHRHSRMPSSPPPPPRPPPGHIPPPAPTYSYCSSGENRPISDFDNFIHYFSEENPTSCVVM
ncbi:hypothetical protein ACH5RR_006980 [Cinchona calisaya]|uniref:HMA domain-containing protein n=1 Tax=Cinchona calisaya TaxID=153742 RepID=A0ABD3AQG4_9GENT